MASPGIHEDLVTALRPYTPSSILKNGVRITLMNTYQKITYSIQTLRTCFQQFFEKGTLLECCELLGKHFKPEDILAFTRSPLPLGTSHVASAQPHDAGEVAKPQDRLTTQTPFFRSLNLDQARLKRIISIGQSIVEIGKDQDYGESVIRECATIKDAIVQIRELYIKIESVWEEATVTDRMCLLYFGNSIERYAASDMKRVRHRSGITTAFDHVTVEGRIERKIVTNMYNAGVKYLELAKHGGFGFLCWAQGSKSEIMGLREEDVKLLRDYISEDFPEINAKLQDIDRRAKDSVIRGLQVQGWSNADILEGRTGLTRLISKHMDDNAEAVEPHISHTAAATRFTPSSTVADCLHSSRPIVAEQDARSPDQRATVICYSFAAGDGVRNNPSVYRVGDGLMSTCRPTEASSSPKRRKLLHTVSITNDMDIRQSIPTDNVDLLYSKQDTQQTTVSSSLEKSYLITANSNEQGFVVDQFSPHRLPPLSPLLPPSTPQHANDDTSCGDSSREAPQSSSNEFTYVKYITHTLTEEDRIAFDL